MVTERHQIDGERISVLGIPVSNVNMDRAVDLIDQLVQSGDSHIVTTADSSGIVIAKSDPELTTIYKEASLVTPDSYGVVWGLKKAGIRADRVTGVDLVDRLFKLSAEKGYRVFLLGAEPGIADAAAERIRLLHPGINIVGTHHGYFPATDDEFVAQEVAPHKPDILIVAMGIPRQEKFITHTMPIIKAKVGIGVGGTLDVYSGRAKRAPKLIQKMRMEWLWRVILNPKKLTKTMMLPRFAWMLLTEKKK
ncbi:MAG: WecB/TagA/CpsF family glycosyltransferase [Armatimonadetes bacterium]|nr:WecB/TagA/CpsF family glycosyltransferase [Armatimonadota bacterium]